MATKYITSADVFTYLEAGANISAGSGDIIEDLIYYVEAAADKYCKMGSGGLVITEYTDTFDGDDHTEQMLDYWPAQELVSIVHDGTTKTLTDFKLVDKCICRYVEAYFDYDRELKWAVTYTAGHFAAGSATNDLKLALIKWVAWLFNKRGRDGLMSKSQSPMVNMSESYELSDIPMETKSILDRYKDPRVML